MRDPVFAKVKSVFEYYYYILTSHSFISVYLMGVTIFSARQFSPLFYFRAKKEEQQSRDTKDEKFRLLVIKEVHKINRQQNKLEKQ